MIRINFPEIAESDTGTRLQCSIKINNEEKILWYEVEKKYAEYLTAERADAFLVGLLLFALKRGHDIEVLAPVSARLNYTVNAYLAPLLIKNFKYKPVKIICKQLVSEPIINKGAVGTGLSCGVDSFSTIYDHTGNTLFPEYNITHFTFFNVGSHGDFGGEKANNLFLKRAQASKSCASVLGKEFIMVNSNLSEILKMSYKPTHTLRNMSVVLTMQKLFKTYYYASAFPVTNFKLSNKSSAMYDIFTLNMLSTETIDLFSSGSNDTRVEKTKKISNIKSSYKYLNVCFRYDFDKKTNCGACPKCLRTLLTFEILGKIDKYRKAFDMEAYKREKDAYIQKIICNSTSSNPNVFLKEIFEEMKRTGFTKQK